MKKLNVLVACEESQAVAKEFRLLNHNAFSCDLQKCSGGHHEYHINNDVLKVINGKCFFKTQDGIEHFIDTWDLIIAHPPCTDLSVSGARHFEKKRNNGTQRKSIEFFCRFLNLNCKHVLIENPVNIISGKYISKWFKDICELYDLPKKPTQIIQPYEFGDPYRKKTCLWLKNLPPLKPTKIVDPKLVSYTYADGSIRTYSVDMVTGFTNENRGVVRSKTYPGIAKAIAEQYSEFLKIEV